MSNLEAVEDAPPEEGGEGWRDDVVEVEGVAAAELRTLFYKTWRRLRLLERLPEPRRVPKDLLPLRRHPSSRVYVLASLRRSRRNLRREYLTRLNRATRAIDIANSYFLPDRHGRAALGTRGPRRQRHGRRAADAPRHGLRAATASISTSWSG